jgi:hypothetical protein
LPKILIFDNYKNVRNCSILKENKKDVKCVKKIFSNFDIMKYESTNFQEFQGIRVLKEYSDEGMSKQYEI